MVHSLRMQLSTPISVTLLTAVWPAATKAQSFVNWENPHVHPLDRTPDGSKLLAVNTADNRLEVFDISSGSPVKLASIPAGLDPVTVRARTDNEAWVISHISDTINIIDLTTLNVVRTIRTDDEPADVIFAPSSNRAFVSCSQANTVLVYNLADLSLLPQRINIIGDDPRALAYSAARNEVYVAVFQSGNRSTILGGGSTMAAGFPPNVVSDALGPYGGVNPPPNDGPNFKPAQLPGNPIPPPVALIVKKDELGRWMDDNNHEWTSLVSGANASRSGRPINWNLFDHDVAIINAGTLSVTYAKGLMNICMSLAVNPASGEVSVVGTDATNEVRFEPVLQGRFLRINLGRFDPAAPTLVSVNDLNQHLAYGTTIPFVSIPQADRELSVGDPRAIAWNAAGTRAYVVGMGSNNIIMIDANGTRMASVNDPARETIEVGEGPTGVVLNEIAGRMYVLNKFDASISVIDLAVEDEIDRVPFHDSTPAAVKKGRKHLYDTHANSGLGHVSCASCHVDARLDMLAWDLGDPSGTVKAFNQNCAPLNNCQAWHPMKGPMTTQTLQDIVGKEPQHWRGDRDGLEEFSHAFQGLLGGDAPLSTEPPNDEMQEFEDFLATIYFPPNPYRNFDNTLPTSLPLPGHFTTGRFGPAGQPLPNGNAVTGLTSYRTGQLDGVQCVTCHSLPTGAGSDTTLVGTQFVPIPLGPNGEHHLLMVSVDGSTNISIKVPHLRNQYEKVGMELTQVNNTLGFGFLHDGSVDSLARFLNEPVFNVTSDQMTANLVALMLSFAGGDFGNALPLEPPGVAGLHTHASVGRQTTLISAASPAPGQLQLITDMINLANTNRVGLVVKGRSGGIQRGWRYNGSNIFQSDRSAETITAAGLQASAAAGSELTYTLVPKNSETRIGIDRDADGYFDRDEIDQCSDPADANSVPGSPSADIDADQDEDMLDVAAFVGVLIGQPLSPWHIAKCDLNCDAAVDGRDAQPFVDALLSP